jgi:hypothetical protein
VIARVVSDLPNLASYRWLAQPKKQRSAEGSETRLKVLIAVFRRIRAGD